MRIKILILLVISLFITIGIFYYLSNNTTEIIEGPSTNDIRECFFNGYEGNGLYVFEKDGKYGFVDKDSAIIITPKYDCAMNFIDSLAIVFNGDLNRSSGFPEIGVFGVINIKGEEIIPLEYSNLGLFINGLARVQKNRKWGFIDKTNKLIIPIEYNYVENFSDNLAKVFNGEVDSFEIDATPLKGKFGFVNNKGELIIPLVYDNASDFTEGKAVVSKDGKEFNINKNNEIITDGK